MMKTTIKQEMTKLVKQQIIFKTSGALILLITSMALVTKFSGLEFMSAEALVPKLFNSGWLIVFSMVYLASQTFSMEFRFGTIKNLLQNKHSRQNVFLAKILTLIGYSCFLNLVALVMTIVLSLILFPEVSLEQVSIWQTLLANLAASFVGMWLFASLSLMISLLVHNETLASMLGLASYFMSSMIAGLQFMLLDQATWLRWNPFNMLNLANQLADSSLEKMTLLSTNQLVLGNLLYIVLFLAIAKIVFDRKKV